MFKFTFSNLLLLAGLGYFLTTAWTLYEVFFPADCHAASGCLKPTWTPVDQVYMKVDLKRSRTSERTSLLKTNYFSLNTGDTVRLNVTPPPEVFHNRTIESMVTLATKSGVIWSAHVPLIVHKEPMRTAFNLLSGKNMTDESEPSSPVSHRPVSFWLSVMRVYLLKTPVIFSQNAVPPEIIQLLQVQPRGSYATYQPLVYVNAEMQRSVDWIQVPELVTNKNNESVHYPPLEFTLSVEPESIGKFRLRCMLGMMAVQLRSYGFRQKDIDEVRQLLVDTNFYFLLTTMFVSVFHILFDFLAFKSDISFWRKAENTTGLSMRTVVWRFVSGLIIFLHLCEERSSLLVIVPMGISTLIELWKLARIFKFSFSLRRGFQLGTRSEDEQETDKLDAQFMFWLQCLMLPLCAAGAVYSLLYTPHRSWYSWCLQTLVHGVYAFGFLFMTPQLFINYRLKSVAHLPWKALTYKAFNTFIDDFFAMIIVMPTSHRIACLRDDVVFLVYLYQRWYVHPLNSLLRFEEPYSTCMCYTLMVFITF
ncbi:Cleft lip and palate transmembrane protein 1 [Paragonimus heterotremus]|uniref:Lipid scramblase CLPTM1L n=1 Tax=Paragonimus heterotremus TaxID=100268 RepID=A0A8J4WEL7_9TREM|nr:Cleft lip and palate transmembrane protein 1 [Paragonimus heterotremus]